jgi:glycosyltransferase involved in cell wall biosynthesis
MSVELTIFIPIFNQPEKLIKCLHSLRSQTFKKFIVFVVDDNSTLEYIYWLKEYEDLEIKYIKNENRLGAFSNILNCLHSWTLFTFLAGCYILSIRQVEHNHCK